MLLAVNAQRSQFVVQSANAVVCVPLQDDDATATEMIVVQQKPSSERQAILVGDAGYPDVMLRTSVNAF